MLPKAKEIVDASDLRMKDAVSFLEEDLKTYRVGKATPSIFNGVTVDYYGSPTPLMQVASITTPDAKTIAIQPWERKIIGDIEKAIMNSEVGITPENNGEMIRLSIPPLTEERRKQLVKQTRGEGEDAKISVRNARRDAIEGLKKEIKNGLAEDAEKDAENEVQKIHDRYIKKIDDLLAAKEKEIMTV